MLKTSEKPSENLDSPLQLQQESQEDVLMDFSNMFKPARQANLPKRLQKKVQQETKNSDQVDEKQEINIVQKSENNIIPQEITITQEQMKVRRCLDIRRWYCLSRPQYQRTCGISSVVTVWNYLFSSLGVGTLSPISQEQAIVKLNLAKADGAHFNDIDFGQFSGNLSLITWFKNLCRLFGVKGRAYFLWKHRGRNSTPGVDREVALDKLKQGLQSDRIGFIYHAFDHYFCPMGYELTPNRGFEAYETIENINMDDAINWIIIGETAKPYQFFTIRKWNEIADDIELEYPQYMNIRKMEEGIKEYKNPQIDIHSQHCIMAFERVDQKVKKQIKQQIFNDQDSIRPSQKELDKNE